MHLDHRDNTLQRLLKSFQTKYCHSLRSSGICRQEDKQTIWLNSPTEAENTFTLMEEWKRRSLGDFSPNKWYFRKSSPARKYFDTWNFTTIPRNWFLFYKFNMIYIYQQFVYLVCLDMLNTYLTPFFFLFGFSFTNIEGFRRQHEKGDAISLTLIYHFHPPYRHF